MAVFFAATFFTAFLVATFLAATSLGAFFAAFFVAFFFTAGFSGTNSSGCCGLAAGVFLGLAAFLSFVGLAAVGTTSRGWNESCFGCGELALECAATGVLDCS